jgi:hypothetical protein
MGLDLQKRDFESSFPSYLRGKWQPHGWWYYYIYALAVKVPLGLLFLFLWACGLSLSRPSLTKTVHELIVLLPALSVLVLVSAQTGFNHHMRYVLPIFPFAIIMMGKLECFLSPVRWNLALPLIGLLVWSTISSLHVHPHYLSYFNEAVRGPDNGQNHLVDSNIDWGQDLLYLRDWLFEHPEARPLGLAYYNLIDPQLVGIQFALPPHDPPGISPDRSDYLLRFGPHPGYFAVSVNYVRGSRSIPPPDGKGGKAWPSPSYAYFLRFDPIAKAGYSIFIYHITLAEANRVRAELGLPELSDDDVGAKEKEGPGH